MRVKRPFYILLLLLILFFSFEIVNACSCLRSKPPCGSFGKDSVIFTGEVVGINVVPGSRKQVQFKVYESFNKATTQNLTVETGLGGGDCGIDFKIGENYLVYANEYEGRIGAGLCSRTQLLSQAQNDLEILRLIKSNKSVSPRLFGKIHLLHIDGYRTNASSKIKITAKSQTGKTYETVTDGSNSYRLTGVPVGNYSLQATYKDTFTKTAEAVIKLAKGEQCVEENFYFYEGGSIKGRVLDSDGKPVKDLTVYAERLVFSPEDAKGSGLYNDRTDENGNYEIEGLQNGKYILRINADSAIPNDFPFAPTFYPNAKIKVEAERIVVTTEKPLEGYNIQLPPRLKLRQITGIALFTDGRPIAGGRVEVREGQNDWARMDSADIDKEGRFALKVVEGQSYYLYVYKTWNMPKESKKIYIPKTGEIEPLKIVIHPVQ